ncbi:MAG: peptidoglycan DD-metalloendopeptidase family protein [Patescibacteria group bacterium]|nr:peptidoglycan DD-metalloendopeptidase family protein [Patescibacteria group bacterium]
MFKRVLTWFLVIAMLVPALTVRADLLSDKTSELNNLRKEIEKQQSALDSAKKRSLTLQNQIDILDQQISVAELQLQALTAQIDQTNLQMDSVNADLVDAEVQIYEKKRVLREAIKVSYMRRQTGLLEMLVGSSDLSELMSQLEYITAIEGRISNGLAVLKELNETLAAKKGELEKLDQELKELANAKQLEQNSLAVQVTAKDSMLQDSKLTEAEYQKRLQEAVAEQQRLQQEIAALAKNTRKGELNQGNFALQWPVPSRQISAGFHDADYAARFGMQHNAIDIPTPQGTPIRAPADAFVSKIRFDGSNAYSYIVLDHGNGMVTVYGHVSSVAVSVGQFVPVGSVIGGSGGTPGSTGAGWLTTGPHLHFEVWLDGQARNPLAYLS